MRMLEIVVALAVAGAAPAAADRYPRSYAPPFTPDWAAPQLVVIPEVGTPGMQVEIQIPGKRFHRGVQVFYGDRPMQVLGVHKHTILAVIPWRAHRDDFIYVVDPTGRARTTIPFTLARPPSRYSR